MNLRHLLPFLPLFFLPLLFSPTLAQVPMGREFIVVLPSIVDVNERNNGAAEFRIEVLCPRQTVVTAKWGNGNAITQQTISAGGRALITKPYLTLPQIMANPDIWFTERVEKRSVVITTDQSVSVQATFDTNYRTETYTVWPTTAYDTVFRVPTVMGRGFLGGGIAPRSGFTIVAREDGTDVTITPSVNTLGLHSATLPYTVRLDRFGTYEVKSTEMGDPVTADLSGTLIQASKPVGLLAFSISSVPPESLAYHAKPLLEMAPGLSNRGSLFFAAPFYVGPSIPHGRPRQDPAFVRLYAYEIGTTVDTNGVTILRNGQPLSLGLAEYVTFAVRGPMRIETSRPVTAMMMAPSSDMTLRDSILTRNARPDTVVIPYGDPFLLWLPSADRYRPALQMQSLFVSQRPPYPVLPPFPLYRLDSLAGYPWHHVIMVIAPKEQASSVRVDGQPVTFDVDFPGGTHVGARVRVVPTRHTVTADTGVCALAYGFTWNDSYGTTAGEMGRSIARHVPDTVSFTTCTPRKDTNLILTNSGNLPYRIDSLSFTGVAGQLFYPASLPLTVQPGGQLELILRYSLPSVGAYAGVLRLYTDASNGTVIDVPLRLRRDSAQLNTPASLDFGSLATGEQQRDSILVLRNLGSTPLVIDTALILGGGFEILYATTRDTIAPGESDTIHVRYLAGSGGLRQASLRIVGSPCLETRDIPLKGFKGNGPILLGARPVDFGAYLCATPSSVDSSLWIRSAGSEPLMIDSLRIAGADAALFAITSDPTPVTLPPGDSVEVRLSWNGAGSGALRAQLEIFSTAANAPNAAPIAVDLSARRDRVTLSAAVDTLRLPTIASCSDTSSAGSSATLRLRNGGTIADTITWFDIGGDSRFSVSPTLPIVLQPGVDVELTVTYTPTSDAPAQTLLSLQARPCMLTTSVLLVGERRTSSLALSGSTLDFGLLPPCGSSRTLTLPIENDGATPDTITAFDGLAGSPFTLVTSLPIIIPPGSSASLEFVMARGPFGDGMYNVNGSLAWLPCGRTERVTLRGSIASASLIASSSLLDFGTVRTGGDSILTVTLRNPSQLPITLEAPALASLPGMSVAAPQLPATIAAGDSLAVTLRWSPIAADQLLDAPLTLAGLLVTGSDTCRVETTLHLAGRARSSDTGTIRARMTLAIPDTSAAVDEILSLPIVLTSAQDLDRAALQGLDVWISWPSRLLALEGSVSGASGLSATSTPPTGLNQDRTTLHLQLSGTNWPAGGTLATLPLRMLLGDDDRSEVRIDSARVTAAGGVTIERRDGLVTTLGICVTGGERFIRPRGAVLRSVRPNPITQTATIEIDMMATESVRLELVDALGNRVRRLLDGSLPAGQHLLTFDARELPAGPYLLLLRGEREFSTTSIVITP